MEEIKYLVWNIDPVIVQFGSFGLRWYSLLFAGSFILGYLILKKIFEEEKIPIEYLDKLLIYSVLGTVIGARFGHCLFYEGDYYLSHPLDIIKPWTGTWGENAVFGYQGLASHGAAIGILGALALFAHNTKLRFLWTIDRVVFAVALSAGFIRLGNLMNSEIIGAETHVAWAFIFKRIDLIPRHPSQLYEAAAYLSVFAFIYFFYQKNKGKLFDGQIFSLFLILAFPLRFMLEFFKENQESFENEMTFNLGQMLSIPFFLIGVVLYFVLKKYPPKPSPKVAPFASPTKKKKRK